MECSVCCNEIIYGILGTECLKSHTICASCYHMNNSYRCVYCRRALTKIQVIQQNKTIIITNNFHDNVSIYYAILQKCATSNCSVYKALRSVDIDRWYSNLHELLNNNKKKKKILGLVIYHLFLIFMMTVLNNISIYGIYCDHINGRCYQANFYYVHLMIKGFLTSGTIFYWYQNIHLFYRRSIKELLYSRITNIILDNGKSTTTRSRDL